MGTPGHKPPVPSPAKKAADVRASVSPDVELKQARRLRKDTDAQLQALLNRVTFLQSEESKIDRDIESMRRKAAELLARQAEKTKDEDILSTAKDVLSTMSVAEPSTKPRPGISKGGLSSIRSSTTSIASSVLPPQPQVTAAATPRVTKPAVPPAPKPRASSAQRAVRPPSAALAKSTSLDNSRPARKSSTGAASASTSSPAKSPDRPASGRSTAATANSSRAASPSTSVKPPVRRPSSALKDEPVASSPEPRPAPASKAPHGPSELEGAGLQVMRPDMQGENRMAVLGGHQDVSQELLEQLLEEGHRAGSSSGGGQMEGLVQFSTQNTQRVVQVKTTSLRKNDQGGQVQAVVGGVGWGLPAAATGQALVPTSKQQVAQAQAELQKKQTLWKVRKTFGLEPTPQHDASAQVVEYGAGAWG